MWGLAVLDCPEWAARAVELGDCHVSSTRVASLYEKESLPSHIAQVCYEKLFSVTVKPRHDQVQCDAPGPTTLLPPERSGLCNNHLGRKEQITRRSDKTCPFHVIGRPHCQRKRVEPCGLPQAALPLSETPFIFMADAESSKDMLE